MKKQLIPILLLIIGFLLGGITYYFINKAEVPSSAPAPLTLRAPAYIEEATKAFPDIVRAVSPAVVNISSTKVVRRQPSPFDEFFDFLYPFPNDRSKRWRQQSLGSGVIISPEGYIITNNHVVEQADDIRVTLIDEKSFKAKIIGSDPKTDIAVIKIDAKGLPTIPWGNSDRLQVGEFVLAIGNPFGLNHTVTMGIISAVGRVDMGITDYENFIQTDAAINPGNSGGPLVNIKGELIGINTAIFSKTGGYLGIGFTVPSNMVRIVMDQLIKEGKVTRGWIGVVIQDITPGLAQKFGLEVSEGALISNVVRGGPAYKAGIMRGDIILGFSGKRVKNAATLRNLVAQSKVDSQIEIMVLRQNKEVTIKATIQTLPAKAVKVAPAFSEDIDMTENALYGVVVMDINPTIAKQLGMGTDEKGVVIAKMEADAPAEGFDIRKGDVIQEIDGQRISNLNDFNKVVSKIGPDDIILLFINRNGKRFYIALQP